MTPMSTQLKPSDSFGDSSKTRSPFSQLLHALNQPLTGLQCSLELAAAGPRPTEEYVRVLREALELLGRMRMLVEALRELGDACQADLQHTENLALDDLLRATVDDLLPVALAQGSQICIETESPVLVRANRCHMRALLFRFLESSLSLTRKGSTLKIALVLEDDVTCFTVSWESKRNLEHSAFSRPALGLLIAEVGWQQLGAEWTRLFTGGRTICKVRMPIVSSKGKKTQTGASQ